MGTKGDKLTKNAHLSAETLVDKLSAIAGIRSKKMFGGYGIFREEKMFGIVDSEGTVYFKVGDQNQAHYQEAQKHGKMPYFKVPEAVLNNPEELVVWAEESIAV